MSFIEFLGFIITLVAMTVIVIRKSMEDWDRRKHPEKYEDEENRREEELKKLLKSLEIDIEDEKEFSPPKKKPVKAPPPPRREVVIQPKPKMQKIEDYSLTTSIERRGFKSSLEEQLKRPEQDAYSIKKQEATRSRGFQLMGRLKSKKEMIILQEILSKPKAMRTD